MPRSDLGDLRALLANATIDVKALGTEKEQTATEAEAEPTTGAKRNAR